VNDEARDAVVRKVEEAVWNLEGKVVTLLGLAFKAGTDDVRGSPAMVLAEALYRQGAIVRGADPMASASAAEAAGWLQTFEDPYVAAKDAHCLVLCTAWPRFRELDLERVRRAMAQPALVDARNLFSPAEAAAAGFLYFGIGRPSTAHGHASILV
jgi:UDPglucose 6-dehydrogenase